MIRKKLFVAAFATLSLLTVSTFAETPAVNEQEAHAIAVDAYLYLYPLVIMDITRKQSTNIEPGKAFGKGILPPVSRAWCA